MSYEHLEANVLGSLMVSRSGWDRGGHMLRPEDFRDIENQNIFVAIRDLVADGAVPDTVAVAETLERSGKLPDGPQYIAGISNHAVSAANIETHCKMLQDQTMRRVIHKTALRMQTLTGSGREQLIQVQMLLSEMEQQDPREPIRLSECAKEWLGVLAERAETAGEVVGRKMGFCDVDRRTGGLRPGDLIVIAGRPAMGKAQPLDSNILMANGSWKKMAEIQIGDKLAKTNRAESKVTGIFPQGNRDIYRVTLEDGRQVDADKEHLWNVSSSKWGNQERTVTTGDIIDLLGKTRYQGRLYIRQHQIHFGSDSQLAIDPWLLGVLIGDGCLSHTGVIISNTSEYVQKRCVNATHEDCETVIRDGGKTIAIKGREWRQNPVLDALREYGLYGCVANEKFIPSDYKTTSYKNRLKLLVGLVESDGWVEKQAVCLYSTASQRLANDVVDLVNSLGGHGSIRAKNPKYKYKGEMLEGQMAYIVNIRLAALANAIGDEKKRERLHRRKDVFGLKIRSVEKTGNKPAQCIRVSNPSSLYITDHYVVTHNTALAMSTILTNCAEGQTCLMFSLEMDRASLMDRIVANISKVPMNLVRTPSFLDEQDWPKITAATQVASTIPWYLDDEPSLAIQEIHSRARRIKRKHGLGLLVVDYIQLVETDRRHNSRRDHVAEVSRTLKKIAKDLQVPVIALSQLNRKCEDRNDKRPLMSDLYESGSVEQDADAIGFVYRDEVYNEHSEQKGVCELIWRKVRNGAPGTDYLWFDGPTQRFRQADRDSVPRATVSTLKQPYKRKWKGG